jgi:hypothetical protein
MAIPRQRKGKTRRRETGETQRSGRKNYLHRAFSSGVGLEETQECG